jgi:DUF1680 family protein
LELASLTSARTNPQPATLSMVLEEIPSLQQTDGHFGAVIDWNLPIDFEAPAEKAMMMPVLWGNGRLLLGLDAAYERFGDRRVLNCARKLGDFYAGTVVNRFCNPSRVHEYQKEAGGYAAAYVTCVYSGLEGLVKLYHLTGDKKYLAAARRMADFHAAFDTLPVGHTHGSLCVHEALLMLYETTGERKYLARVTNRWNEAVDGGYVSAAGGVLEKFVVSGFGRDEGCAEADWLRLNLMLWRDTGRTEYLDMAERLLWNEYAANQWPDGGYGHRNVDTDPQGVYALNKYSAEAVWCCCFHGPLGLRDLKGCLAAGGPDCIYYNFPMEFSAPVRVGKRTCLVTSKIQSCEDGFPVCCAVTVKGPGRTPMLVRVPEWAGKVEIETGGRTTPILARNGYLLTAPLSSGEEVRITYRAPLCIESRQGRLMTIPAKLPARMPDVVLRHGPALLFNTSSGAVQDVKLSVHADGSLSVAPGAGVANWAGIREKNAPHAFVFNADLE